MKDPTRREWLLQAGSVTAAAALWHRGLAMTTNALAQEPAKAGRSSPGGVPAAPLLAAMHRAGECCLAWLDPQHHWLPTGGYEMAHDTGRWWDAMLRLQATTGFTIPPHLEAAMLENIRALTDNPAGLLTNDTRAANAGGIRQVNPHNFRESMLAFSALVRHRSHEWSLRQGKQLTLTTESMLEPDGQMDYVRLAELMQLPLNQDPSMIQRSPAGQWFDATGTTGRALEGFVCFHESTGDPRALDLAARLAETHLRNLARPDGKIPPELLDARNVGHNHSFLGTLRGLLRYGLCTGHREYVDAVARMYRNGLFGTVVSESGWTPHDLGKSRFPNEYGDPLGEHASCADVVQLALWLSLQAGQVDLLDDVERLLRARILPSQIVDPMQPRQHGGWGVYAHPFGRGCILDVFAAVLSVLTEVHQAVVVADADGTVSVNLHFSTEMPLASIQAVRDTRGRTVVRLAQPAALRIRVPAWSPRESVAIRVADQPIAVQWDGAYAVVPSVPGGATIALDYELPTRNSVETMPVSRQAYRLVWRGDEVVACEPEAPIYRAK